MQKKGSILKIFYLLGGQGGEVYCMDRLEKVNKTLNEVGRITRSVTSAANVSRAHPQIDLHLKRMRESIASMQKSLEPVIKEMRLKVEGIGSIMIEASKKLNELVRDLPEIHKFLISRSWYLDGSFDLSLYPKLQELCLSENWDEVDSMLCSYYESRLSKLQNEAQNTSDDRKPFMQRVFKAHLEEDYIVSIPLTLMQADGVFKEVFGEHFFRTLKSKKVVQEAMESEEFELSKAMFGQAGETGGVRENTSRIDSTVFNRHRILHGDDFTYPSRKNSLKALSILSFVLMLREWSDRRCPETGDHSDT